VKVVFSPRLCENPDCQKFVLYRTDWLDIARGFGHGHGYKVCRKCLATTVEQVKEHNFVIELQAVASGAWRKNYNASSVLINGEWFDEEKAQERLAKLNHNCPFCKPCPTHGY